MAVCGSAQHCIIAPETRAGLEPLGLGLGQGQGHLLLASLTGAAVGQAVYSTVCTDVCTTKKSLGIAVRHWFRDLRRELADMDCSCLRMRGYKQESSMEKATHLQVMQPDLTLGLCLPDS